MLPIGRSKRNHNYYNIRVQNTLNLQNMLFEETYNAGALEICRKRMNFAIVVFFIIYAIIAVRVFMVCLPNGIEISLPQDDLSEREIMVKAPISRADIVDRNGIEIGRAHV